MPILSNVSGQEKPDQQKWNKPSTGTISGTVSNESGYPLAGAVVYVRPLNSTTLARTVLTDAEGKFVLHSLDSTLYKVWAIVPAYVMPERAIGDRNTYYRVGDSVRLEMMLGGVITGKVTSAAGNPVVGIRVRALPVSRLNARQSSEPERTPAERLTDDRGIYRIYGLSSGTYVVSAGGAGTQWSALNPYDAHAPTFAPSSTLDTASQIIVRAGQESNVDIRYRVDQGRTITGTVRSSGKSGATVSLMTVPNNGLFTTSNSYLNPDTNGFVFYGVTDGEYDLVAHSGIGTAEAVSSDMTMSETKRITVKGVDVTGLEFVLQPLGYISGYISLESSNLSECESKRPLMSETVVELVRNRERVDVKEVALQRWQAPPAIPNGKGEFVFRNLRPGQYVFRPQFFAQYWYVQSISRAATPGNTPLRKSEQPNTKGDVARYWTVLKSGDRITDLRISLAEGAASLRGQVTIAEGEKLADQTTVYLVPSERENQENVLRFFATETDTDGTFSISNVAPGHYWVVAMPSDTELTPANVSLPNSSPLRKSLRQLGAKTNLRVQIKPCQNVENLRVSLPAK